MIDWFIAKTICIITATNRLAVWPPACIAASHQGARLDSSAGLVIELWLALTRPPTASYAEINSQSGRKIPHSGNKLAGLVAER